MKVKGYAEGLGSALCASASNASMKQQFLADSACSTQARAIFNYGAFFFLLCFYLYSVPKS
jgi:hypothetical protein